MHYYQFNIKSYHADTTHLTNDEDLAYRRLLDMYYDTELPIPTALPVLTRRLRLALPVLESVLNEFFTLTDNGWVNDHCDKVLAEYKLFIDRQKLNGSKGGRGNKATALPNKATALPNKASAKPTINNKPLTINQEPITKSQNLSIEEELSTVDPWDADF
jgi:uncharacterized protein YdaU (DUF1376 family)